MQHMAYQSLLPTVNKYLQQKWDMASYEIHLRKVKSAKPTIDTTAPKTYGHLALKMKKKQLEEQSMSRIQRENEMLLEKMSHIRRTTGRINNRNDYENKSLCRERQQKERLRITKENELILLRLSQCQSHYSIKDWHEDWHKTLKLMENIARYPQSVKDKKGATTRRKQASISLASATPPTQTPELPESKPATDDAPPVATEESTGSDSKKDMLEEITNMNATLQVVAKDVTTIKDTTKEVKDSMEDIKVRLGEAEERISDIEDASAMTEAKVDKYEERLEVLWSRVEDLENRSRRNNVRIIGLKEGVEVPGKVDQYVTEILDKAFEFYGREFEIERAHRSPVPMPDRNKPPRAIIVRFLRSSAREKVLQVARAKRGIDWEGAKLSFFEDVTRELAEKRKAFNPAIKRLRELQVKHRMAYPATLIFMWNGQQKTFNDEKKAEEFLQQSN
ncbi:hypothetical protein DPEC_G00043430 [Dallia pectoralis]|uniref:Uncharacterized protein n=1 Tax=Dallia pectoralis TaxID=75939 RepID=A0ACC2H991_DALPE|nr:hypothetical protein DPEC_G00043430 [Dallia pectoralis]